MSNIVFKTIKLSFIIIFLNLACRTGHCIKIEQYDPTEEISVAVLSRIIVPREPITYLDASFFCYPSYASCEDIRSIALICSNGQTFETETWQQGRWLPFLNAKTKKAENLIIKASDCPINLTFEYLTASMPAGKVKKRQREIDPISIVYRLEKRDLFSEDGNSNSSELKLYTSGIDWRFSSLGILKGGEDFAPSPWNLWPIKI